MRRRIPEHALTEAHRTLLSQFLDEARTTVHEDYEKARSPFRSFFLYLEREVFSTKCSIGAARKAANIRSNTYSARFCQMTGLRPRAYVEHHRIMLARRIIRHIPLHFWEVAAKVGFEDPSVFSRTYRRVLGHSPSQEEEWTAEPPPTLPDIPQEGLSDPRISLDTA